MSNININTDALNEEIIKLDGYFKEIDEIFNEFSTKEKYLESVWSSDNADRVYGDLKNAFSKFDAIKEKNNNFVSFLKNMVSDNYKNADEDISKYIDTKIAEN